MDFRNKYYHMYEQIKPAQGLLQEVLARVQGNEEIQRPKNQNRGGIWRRGICKTGK